MRLNKKGQLLMNIANIIILVFGGAALILFGLGMGTFFQTQVAYAGQQKSINIESNYDLMTYLRTPIDSSSISIHGIDNVLISTLIILLDPRIDLELNGISRNSLATILQDETSRFLDMVYGKENWGLWIYYPGEKEQYILGELKEIINTQSFQSELTSLDGKIIPIILVVK